MVRRLALFGLFALSSTALAQGVATPITAAAACRNVGNAYQARAVQAARDSGKSPDPVAITSEVKRLVRGCADTLSTTAGSVTDLTALSTLWLYVGDTAKAERIVAALSSRASQSEAERADILLASMQLAISAWDPFAGINPKAEAHVRQLDGLSDSVVDRKITGHMAMLGRYEYADIDDGIRDHAQKVLALSRRALELNALPVMPARPAQGNQPAVPAVSRAYIMMMEAYGSLARAAGDYLHADSALMILDEAERVVAPRFPPAAANFERARKMYRLVGTRATSIDGKWWVNTADGSVVRPGDGKISIVQFTAHWCVPCKKSYDSMNRLMEKYKGKPVESIMATELYGYIGSRRNLTAEQEVAADREYYGVEHKLNSIVAINPASTQATYPNTNEGRYAVGGIPEIVIIDRKGVIRATVVGWDKGNEARFATLIDKLLAEK
jgi:thiol-disulfide isomerase/thioredoxin